MLSRHQKEFLYRLLYEYNLIILLILSPILISHSNIIYEPIKIHSVSSNIHFNLPGPSGLEINTNSDQTPRFEGLKTQKTPFNLVYSICINNDTYYQSSNKYKDKLSDPYNLHQELLQGNYLLIDLPPPSELV